MAQVDLDGRQVSASILYWGVPGAGKSTNLRVIHDRLRPGHRGPLATRPSAADPLLAIERLPIELGEVGGLRTRLEVVAAPAGPGHAEARRELLGEADGVVLVVDSRRERFGENLEAFEELRRMLAHADRALDEVPLVIQYNKRDLAVDLEHEELHRKLGPPGVAVFEAVAPRGQGVLSALTTVCKRVVRGLRERDDTGPAPARSPSWAGGDFGLDPTQIEPVGLEPVSPRRAERGGASPSTRLRAAAAYDPFAEDELELTDPEPEPTLRGELLAQSELEEAGGLELVLEDALGPDEHAELTRAAERAQTLLEAAWPEAAGGLHTRAGSRPAPKAGAADLEIVAVRGAQRLDGRSLRVELVLRDARGGEQPFSLTLRLDPLLGGGDDR